MLAGMNDHFMVGMKFGFGHFGKLVLFGIGVSVPDRFDLFVVAFVLCMSFGNGVRRLFLNFGIGFFKTLSGDHAEFYRLFERRTHKLASTLSAYQKDGGYAPRAGDCFYDFFNHLVPSNCLSNKVIL